MNKGSKKNPYLLTIKWMPNKKEKPIVLVGKGVMFDTGGINIKRWDFHDMKTDMTGAAVVLSVLKLCAINNLKKNVVGLIPLVENMIGTKSIRPGDIIKSHSGQTVEIIDTDANHVILPGDQVNVPANTKYRFLGNISILQTTTAIMSLYLAFVAATN